MFLLLGLALAALWAFRPYLRRAAARYNTFICRNTSNKTSSYQKFIHKIVIIGDDFASGEGDSLYFGSLSGLSRSLCLQLKKERKLKHAWHIFNQGVSGSTSRDWVPKSEWTDSDPAPTYFNTTFDNPKMTDCSIVIIMVGSNDARASPKISPTQTISNIISICKVLQNMGKEIWLCPISQWRDMNVKAFKTGDQQRQLENKQDVDAKHTRDDKKQEDHKEGENQHEKKNQDEDEIVNENQLRNDMLMDYIKTHSDKIYMGPGMDGKTYEFKHDSFYTESGLLNAKGYTKLAKDFNDLMFNNILKHEFNALKKFLR